MADIELVIKVSEDVYTRLLARALRLGKPLPNNPTNGDVTLEELKKNIEWLIDQYDQSIMMLEQDISENPIGNTYNIGRLKTEKEIREHLMELLDENNYERSE